MVQNTFATEITENEFFIVGNTENENVIFGIDEDFFTSADGKNYSPAKWDSATKKFSGNIYIGQIGFADIS